jgi:hypothetical protein
VERHASGHAHLRGGAEAADPDVQSAVGKSTLAEEEHEPAQTAAADAQWEDISPDQVAGMGDDAHIADAHAAVPKPGPKPIHRHHVHYGRDQLKYRGRGYVQVVKEVTVLSSDGTHRGLKIGERFHFGGVDDKGYCVMYSDKEGANPPTPDNPKGSTFLGVAHRRYLRIEGKDGKLQPIHTKAVRRGAHRHGRSRRRGAIGFDRPMASTKRTVFAHPLPKFIVQGPGAPMYEYTHVGGGNYVSGAETPADLTAKSGKQIGKGYTTGMIEAGTTFYDIRGQLVPTPVRHNDTQQPGTAYWTFGWVVQHQIKIWMWMLDHIMLGTHYTGNVK